MPIYLSRALSGYIAQGGSTRAESLSLEREIPTNNTISVDNFARTSEKYRAILGRYKAT
ncbi:hypothetical protein HOY82DRAFT_489054 [Tuber indicum]|nr:hypothetical protein HOY82DRAFT_489054 [Tuber indicum]